MKEWVKDVVIAVLVAVVIMQFIKPTIVKETSMQPTLYENNYIFLSKQSYRFGEPQVGDIVVFRTDLRTEMGKKKLLIKRIVGVPGDTIRVEDGKVYRNEEELIEPYTLEPYTSGYVEDTEVPADFLFVMGDNRGHSRDSRDPDIGMIKKEDIVGKAVLRIYPFNEFGLLD